MKTNAELLTISLINWICLSHCSVATESGTVEEMLSQTFSTSLPFVPLSVFSVGVGVYAIPPLEGSVELQTAGIMKHGNQVL